MLLQKEKKMKEKGNFGAAYVLHTLFPLLFLMQLLLCKLAVETFKHAYFDLIIEYVKFIWYKCYFNMLNS